MSTRRSAKGKKATEAAKEIPVETIEVLPAADEATEESALLDSEPAEETEGLDFGLMDEGSFLNDDVTNEEEKLDDNEPSESKESLAAGEADEIEAQEGDEENAGKEKTDENDQSMEVTENEKVAKEDEDEDAEAEKQNSDEMPQVNVDALAKRLWQVKVFPLKPHDFLSGQISRVFTNAKESLLYILGGGKYGRGKAEMFIASPLQAVRVVQNLMKLDFESPEINLEITRKSDENTVEEKATMTFDTKLVRMLCVPLLPSRRVGSNREQIIGSVFVKNLPNSTSKEILRVMFPFAPEINYNPEKFTDRTARLVLNTRSAVVPCLKAFKKVELNGTVLELRPLQRKVRTTSESGKESESDGTKAESKDGAKTDSEDKKDKEASKANDDKTDSSKKSSPAAKTGVKKQDKKVESGTRSSGRSGDQKSKPGDRSTRGRGLSDRYRRDTRDFRNDSGLRNRYQDRNSFSGTRSRFPAAGGFGRRVPMDTRRVGAAGDTGVNTETKEMILLQSQLNMAIKNQMVMLNQTQLALEQAKREAVSLSLTREAAQASTSDYGYKRSADMAGLSAEYGLGKRRVAGRGLTPSWAEDRAYGHQGGQRYGYGLESEVDDRDAGYALPASYGAAGYSYRY